MKQNSLFFYLLLVILAIAVASSCEKDDIKPSMEGTLAYELPDYCYIGDVFVLTLVPNITEPTKDLEYFWCSADDIILEDTISALQPFTMQIPADFGTYSITAFAEDQDEDYNNRVNTKKVEAIDTTFGASVLGIRGTDSIVDPRDGIQYYIEEIGNLVWFSQNLRYAGEKGGAVVGASYDDEKILSVLYGRLYTWEEATGGESSGGEPTSVVGSGIRGICPEGWSIPTKEDWVDFGKALNRGRDIDGTVDRSYDNMWYGLASKAIVDATLNGEKMWPYSYGKGRTNESLWNGIPAGNSLSKNDRFENKDSYGMWWSGTEVGPTEASYRYIYYNNTFFAPHEVSKTEFGASVRCVKNISVD